MASSPVAWRYEASTALAALGPSRKLLLLLANAIPLFQVLGLAGLLIWARHRPGLAAGLGLCWVYLVPPLLCRLLLTLLPIRRSTIPLGSRDFFVWWFALNLQVLFCRFPFLEELLRLVPSLYSLWLRLWGARIGKPTYWAAGMRILDRSFLVIGDHVTFGAEVRLNAHVLLPDEQGRLVLLLAPIVIGDRVGVGGYSLLVAGTRIAADQMTRAFLILPPFSEVVDGRRVKPTSPVPTALAASLAEPPESS